VSQLSAAENSFDESARNFLSSDFQPSSMSCRTDGYRQETARALAEACFC